MTYTAAPPPTSESFEDLQNYLYEQLQAISNELIILRDSIVSTSYIKGASVRFEGAASNGPVATFEPFNIASAERMAQGQYKITVQNTIEFPEKLAARAFIYASHNIAPTPFFSRFWTDAKPLSNNEIEINVWAIRLGVLNRLVAWPYDPKPGDSVDLNALITLANQSPVAKAQLESYGEWLS